MRNVLKGGLLSLIPHRDLKDADEALEKLDEEVQEKEEGEEEPIIVAPKKPLVTPLTFAEEEDDEAEASAPAVKQARKVPVQREKKENVAAVKETAPEAGEATHEKWDKHEGRVEHVAIGTISVNPNQPRRTFDESEMADLTDSIDQHGILQPLVVRRLANNKYELIAGERRLRAAKSLGWEKVPCVVRLGVKTNASRLELALIENIQRQDLNPVEEALAYKQLNEEYGLTHEEIGERVGRSRVGITNSIRLLQLPEEVQKGISDGRISSGHAKAILMIPDQEKQVRFYRHMVEEGLTVRKAETRARRIQRTMNIDEPMRLKRKGRSAFEMKYSGQLEDRYGFDGKVRFLESENRFEVVFRCYSQAEIEELLGRLLGERELPTREDKDVIDAGTEAE
ncbi:MAG TPA: ParB/RepB/Spo0J family partition protein [Candidatus Andersenbacteria bacterium]|nr:ParB/RepB/Spo0J family partition protein [Candidatus Andersenbacteria bacterium]